MRSSWSPLAALCLVAVALAPARADACFAPAAPVPAKPGPGTPPDLMLGTTTAAVAWDPAKKIQHTTLIPEVRGELKKFALLIPVRGRITRRDLKVLSDEVHFQLLAQTRPTIEVVRDTDPCDLGDPATLGFDEAPSALAAEPAERADRPAAAAYGVRVEGHFEVGEYDLALLSAKSAKGLGRWLRRFKYRVDPAVEAALGDALKKGYKILAARVHLKKLAADQFTSLRPLRIRTRFKERPTLPLGVAAASGEAREVVVLALGPDRADLAGHRMLELPTDRELPAFVAEDWDASYGEFATRWLTRLGGGAAGLLEFAGPAPVMGVDALGAERGAFLTRWRVRVEPGAPDLALEPARNANRYRSAFRARAPWDGDPTCDAGRAYLRDQRPALREQAEAYELLTGEPSASTLARLKTTYAASFKDWKKKKPPAKTAELKTSEPDEGGLLGDWWKIAGGLGALVVVLISIGRLQRGR